MKVHRRYRRFLERNAHYGAAGHSLFALWRRAERCGSILPKHLRARLIKGRLEMASDRRKMGNLYRLLHLMPRRPPFPAALSALAAELADA